MPLNVVLDLENDLQEEKNRGGGRWWSKPVKRGKKGNELRITWQTAEAEVTAN